MFAIKKIKDYAGNLLIIICGNLCIANMLIQDTKLVVVVHKAFRLRSFGHRSLGSRGTMLGRGRTWMQ